MACSTCGKSKALRQHEQATKFTGPIVVNPRKVKTNRGIVIKQPKD